MTQTMRGLGENREALLSTYAPLYTEDFPLVLFWIPKSGCTTLNRWFFYQVGLLGDVRDRCGGDVHRYRNEILKTAEGYAEQVEVHLRAGTKTAYKLVRNPYRRAVSSFLSTICSDYLIPLVGSTPAQGLSFAEFLRRLRAMGPRIAEMDRHIGPQYIEGERRYVRRILRVETMDLSLRQLESEHGLYEAPIEKLKESPHHFKELMVEVGDFAERTLTRDSLNWFFPTVHSFYNAETKRLVEEVYECDFRIYRFPKHLRFSGSAD